MPRRHVRRLLPYTPRQMFDLVADIEQYPAFLPWCHAAEIMRREGSNLSASLTVGARGFRERFISDVSLTAPCAIDVTYRGGPLAYLSNAWRFEPAEDGGCLLDFYLDFGLRSRLLGSLVGAFFDYAFGMMVQSFEDRAAMLYSTKPILREM